MMPILENEKRTRNRKQGRTTMHRDQLVALIAGSLQRRLNYMDQATAKACGDGLLRDLKAEGLTITDADTVPAPPADA